MTQPTITKTTTTIAVGQPISGMYSDGQGMCLDYSGTITGAQREAGHYAITVEFKNGTVREYSHVGPDGESDFTMAMGVCDGCGQAGSVFGLQWRHTCP